MAGVPDLRVAQCVSAENSDNLEKQKYGKNESLLPEEDPVVQINHFTKSKCLNYWWV